MFEKAVAANNDTALAETGAKKEASERAVAFEKAAIEEVILAISLWPEISWNLPETKCSMVLYCFFIPRKLQASFFVLFQYFCFCLYFRGICLLVHVISLLASINV